MVKANAKLDHFLASLILVCMIIAMYLANLRGELTEVRKLIDRLLGGGDDRADMSRQYRHYDHLTEFTPRR